MTRESKKILIKSLIPFIAVQLLMFVIAVFFIGGGHGTSIPLIIFYGPLLLFLKFDILSYNPLLAYIVLFLIMFGLFVVAWQGIISKRSLFYVMVSYVLISIIILFYTEVNNLGLGSSRIPINIKVMSGLIAITVNVLFWKIVLGLSNRKEYKE